MEVQSQLTHAHGFTARRLAVWQGFCCLALVGAVWAIELSGLSARLRGAPAPVRPDYVAAALVSVVAALVGLAAILPLFIRRRAASGSAVSICSYCRRVQIQGNGWQELEDFLSENASHPVSHGVCPECCSRVMRDYHSGKKNAGARGTVVQDVVPV